MFLGIFLRSSCGKVESFHITIEFDRILCLAAFMPSGLIPDNEDSLVGIEFSEFRNDSSSDIHILQLRLEGVLISGLDIQEAVNTSRIPLARDLDLRVFTFRQPDFLYGSLI